MLRAGECVVATRGVDALCLDMVAVRALLGCG
jgi:hypothetical protein